MLNALLIPNIFQFSLVWNPGVTLNYSFLVQELALTHAELMGDSQAW